MTLKQDTDYTIHTRDTSTWLDVKHKGKFIALVMNIETARQVIYRDINSKGGSCEYLNEDDFEK